MHGLKKNSVFLIVLCVIALIIPGCGGGSSSDGGWYSSGDSGSTTDTSSPTITSCSLSSQQFTPGSVCTVQGTAFGDTRSTKDGGSSQIYLYYNSGSSYIVVPSANIVSWSATSITFIIPSTVSAGTTYIIVINRIVSGTTYSSSTTSSSTNTITPSSPVNAPVISSISPSSNITAGSTSITIYGSNFGSTQASGSYVGFTLNGVITAALSVTSWSSNYIVLVVPASTPAGSVSAYVQTATGGTSNSYTISVSSSSSSPSISSITPSSASQGGSITISGSNFGSSSTSSYVMIGSVQASITSWSNNTIVCTVPVSVSPGSRNVTVTTSAGTSSAYVITVIAMTGAPSISSITPTTVNQGSNISISGSYFGTRDAKDTSYVMIGSVSGTIVSWTNTLIVVTITTSTTQGSNDVYVIAGGVSSNTSTITIVSSTAPTISSISPTSVTQGAGSSLTIYGTNFGTAGATSYVTIGGYTATITSWGVNTIVVTVPTSVAAGSATVYVIVAGTATNSSALTVSSTTTPSISGISGTTAGSACTISGSGFGGTTGTVTIGGVAATVTSWTSTAVACTFPYTCAPTGTLTLTASTGAASTTYTRTYAWGAVTPINTTTPQNATTKVLFDKRASNLGQAVLIFIQKDSVGANAALCSRRVNVNGTLSAVKEIDADGTNSVSEPDAAIDSNGFIIAVYVKAGVLKSAEYATATDSWSAGDDLSATVIAGAAPKIAVGPNNNMICIWRDLAAAFRISANLWTSTGAGTGAWGAATNLDGAGDASNATPQIAIDGSNNAVCAYLDGPTTKIYGKIYTAATGWPGGWGASSALSNALASSPSLAIDTSGNAVVAYTEGSKIYANRYKISAVAGWEAAPGTQIDGNTATASSPMVGMDSSGNTIVTFLETFVNIGVWYNRRTAGDAGTWSGVPTRLDDTSDDCYTPYFAFNTSGSYGMVAYTQDSGAVVRVVTRLYTTSTNTWATQALLDDGTLATLADPVLAVDTISNAIVMWREALTDLDIKIYR